MFGLVRYRFFRRFIIVLFILPLMFAGGSFLGGVAQQQSIGEVGTLDIPRAEFNARYQRLAERYRQAYGGEEIPQEVAQQIVQQVQSDLLSSYLLRASLEKKGLFAPDSAVADTIRQTPDFQDEDGNFSPDIYQELVSDKRYYEKQVRSSIGRDALLKVATAVPVAHVRDQLAAFRRQQRIVDEAVVDIEALSAVTITILQDDVNLYYQRNIDEYVLREQAIFEYFVVSLDSFAAQVSVSPEAVRQAYDDIIADQTLLQRRRARHIYLSDEEQANDVYALASESPEDFAQLAEQYSEDAATSLKGGDLGIVIENDLPLAMSDELWSMQVGEVSPPVEIDDSFSILKLDAIVAEEQPLFGELYDESSQRARRTQAIPDFEDRIESLRELAPLEIGSLVSMAALAAVDTVGVVTVYRDTTDNQYPFDDELIIVDTFDDFVIKDKENSSPIALGEEAYLFVRARQYQPQGRRPVGEVAEGIVGTLRAQQLIVDIYRQMEEESAQLLSPSLTPAVTLKTDTVSLTTNVSDALLTTAATVDETPPLSSISHRLQAIEWAVTHTVLLVDNDAGESNLDSIDSTEEDDNQSYTERSTETDLSEQSIDQIFAADLTNGLPAYAFEPLNNQVRIFRIRQTIAGEAQEEDFVVIEELLGDMAQRLGNLGYLDELTGQYNYEFYNVPDIVTTPGDG